MDEDFEDAIDTTLEQYETYEQYLDDQMDEKDLFYLEDQELARQLIEVGYHGKGEVLTREQFNQKKDAYQKAKKNKNKASVKAYSHQGLPIEGKVFLEQLAERETHLRNGRMTTILFIRCKNPAGNEISGYIDLAHRMKTEDFRKVF